MNFLPPETEPSAAEQPASSTWWRPVVAPYEVPSAARSSWQLVNTLVPFFGLLALMTWLAGRSVTATLLLAPLLAGFWVRIFIISHDCGHAAFFTSRAANSFWGGLTSFLTLIPYRYWKMEHAKHHGSSGNLDRRGTGDIWTMTVEEYRQASRGRKLLYRLYRNPLVLFGVGPLFLFTVLYRFTLGMGGPRERRSVLVTNLGLLAVFSLLVFLLGMKTVLLVILPAFTISAGAGVWLFYVQHQFEGVYWERDDNWDYLRQAMEGSSYYRLPRILQWFSGNIGFHHVHHLSHRIPNYNLEPCHMQNAMFQRVPEVTFLASLKALRFRLWDEKARQLVGYSALKHAG